MKGARGKPTAVAEILAAVLKDRGLLGSLSLAGLQSRWEGAVGPSIAGHARPDALRGGTLTVIVDSSPWMNQLSLLAPDIMQKLNAATGEEAVTDLRFRIGKVVEPGRKKAEGPFVPKRRRLGADDKAEIEAAVEAIPDLELRAAARRLMTEARTRIK